MQKTKRKYIFVFLFVIGILSSSEALEENTSGKVIEVRGGKLDKWKNGSWAQIFKGSGVRFGDRVRTDAKGLAVIELGGVGRFVVGPDTEMKIGTDKKEFKADMPRGALWFNAKFPMGTGGRITTSIATAGIRGTQFSVFYGNGTKDLCICTCSGMVESTLGNGKTVQVPKGTILAIQGDFPLPEKPDSAFWILEKKPEGYGFCFNCHIRGGKRISENYWD